MEAVTLFPGFSSRALDRTLSSGRRTARLLPGILPDDQDRAVGVTRHRLGDAAHQDPPDAAETPATDHHHPRVDLFGQLDDLLVWSSRPEVRLGHGPAVRSNVLRLG